MKMVAGFTGTAKGMTAEQKRSLRLLFAKLPMLNELHHGDCVGADAEAHALGRERYFRIIVHPPDNPKARAFCLPEDGGAVLPVRPYLDRDRDIVAACDVLYAAPGQYEEVKRDGTWYTVRRAREAGKKIVLVFPDGSVKTEQPKPVDSQLAAQDLLA